MSGLVENFIRRVEKLVLQRATVPPVGTNHVDDTWYDTDIYPGELGINLSLGSLYTSDGLSVIDLNREDMIISGMVLSKSTAGVNKLTVSSGQVRMNGRNYFWQSSGTDLLINPFLGNNRLYFVYAQADTGIAMGYSASTGNLDCTINAVYVEGSLTEPGGVFSAVAGTSGVPVIPANSILLGTFLMQPSLSGYDIWPISVANTGDYYPKFSTSPSELLRKYDNRVNTYSSHTLYFPGMFMVDDITNTIYLSQQTFISDYSTIANDISSGYLVQISGGGGTGSTASMTFTNLGAGAGVYAQTVSTNVQLRSIVGTYPIDVAQGATQISLSIDSGYTPFNAIANLGAGVPIYESTTIGATTVTANLKTIKAGNNIAVSADASHGIVISANGATTQGVNLGTGASVYAGMVGNNLSFKSFSVSGGLTSSVTSNTVNISGQNFLLGASNQGSGPGYVYSGVSSQNLQFRGLSAGSNVSLTVTSDTIIISASGGSGSSLTGGVNVGSTGDALLYAGLSGSNLSFRGLTAGPGINLETVGNDIYISSSAVSGAQGFQGVQGSQGFQGPIGASSSVQGPQGLQGSIGFQGPQGMFGPTGATSNVAGPQGFQGSFGPQGTTGPLSTPAPMRYADYYDSAGGQIISNGLSRYVVMNTQRYLDSLFTPGTVSVSSENGLSMTVNETGNYFFIYDLTTFASASNITTKFTLWNVTAGQGVTGSDVYAQSVVANENITVTGRVNLYNVTSGTQFAIIANVSGSSGNIQFVPNASSWMVSKWEIGMGPQGPAIQGAQGAPGSPGPLGPTGNALVSVTLPLTGNGATSTPVQLSYSSDFMLNSYNQLYLNLGYTTLVTPSITRNWSIKLNDNSTPFPTTSFGYAGGTYTIGSSSSLSSILVPTGCIAAYGGTCTIPATGPGQSLPTNITSSWTFGSTASYPVSSQLSTTGISTATSYSTTLTQPTNGLGITMDGGSLRVVRPAGNDTTYSTDSITYLDIFYWGISSAFGSGNISGASASSICNASIIQGLSNMRLGSKSQTIPTVSDSSGSRLVISYPSAYGDLLSITSNGLDVITAFNKVSSDILITTATGTNILYRTYVAVADNSYTNVQIITA